MRIILVCLLFFVVVYAEIPNYITICQKNVNLSQCLINNFYKVIKHLAGKGEPAFQLEDLRNVKVEEMNFKAGHLVFRFTNQTFKGFENTKLDQFSMTDKQIHMKGSIDRFEYGGNYQMNGSILILPIKGEGLMNVTHTGLMFDYTCLLKIEERNSKKYYYLSNDWNDLTIDLSVKKSYYDFCNLFDGDPQLGREMNAFLNENDAEVYLEVRKALKEGFVFFLLDKYINGYLRHIPIENLFTQ